MNFKHFLLFNNISVKHHSRAVNSSTTLYYTICLYATHLQRLYMESQYSYHLVYCYCWPLEIAM